MKFFKLISVVSILVSVAGLLICTYQSLKPLPVSLADVVDRGDQVRLLDRSGVPLSISYQSRWNVHDAMQFHEFPVLLRRALIVAEDKRFFQHHGQDWLARIHASWKNLLNLRAVRGASTLSEQVIKMIHPRSRTVWSRWIEGWEAWLLEKNNSKQAILTFYLNQVPYAANRRGIKQATRYYFDRDPDTLNAKEIMALVVLIRAPSRLDLYKNTKQLQASILKLGAKLYAQKYLTQQQYQAIKKPNFQLKRPTLAVNAPHFVRYVLSLDLTTSADQWLTSLDGALQTELQTLLDHRLEQLKPRRVNHAALLVVDTHNSEILAWVVGGNNRKNLPGAYIDTVTNYRQPGSALKPFLYALALNRGWTAATKINDAPLSESVAYGMHQYKNYSRVFYGLVSVREALANSLNIPALKTIQYVGAEDYLVLLKSLGFNGLNRHPNIYGDGLALGNAEVSLFELVQAYSVLANRGVFQSLKVFKDTQSKMQQKFSKEISSLISDILSDPNAKRLEFGAGSVLNLPLQTAVKTGTSSDFRDSWAVAYNHQYIVGIWMGNLDNQATEGITGSTGPGLVLRSVFAILNRSQKNHPLYLSPALFTRSVCIENGLLDSDRRVCDLVYDEYFVPGSVPIQSRSNKIPVMRIRQPTSGLHLAVDPRVPINKQVFEFVFQGLNAKQSVDWYINNHVLALRTKGKYLWLMQRGKHVLRAKVLEQGKLVFETPAISFEVR